MLNLCQRERESRIEQIQIKLNLKESKIHHNKNYAANVVSHPKTKMLIYDFSHSLTLYLFVCIEPSLVRSLQLFNRNAMLTLMFCYFLCTAALLHASIVRIDFQEFIFYFVIKYGFCCVVFYLVTVTFPICIIIFLFINLRPFSFFLLLFRVLLCQSGECLQLN